MDRLERLRSHGGPRGLEVLAVRGPAGAVEFTDGREPLLAWHRRGTGTACRLLGGDRCRERAEPAEWLNAEWEEAGRDDDVIWRRLEELYGDMAAQAAPEED